MSTNLPSVKKEDKPFVLAMSSVFLFAGEIGAGVGLSITGHAEGLDFLGKAMLATIGLVQGAWTYYFLTKKNGAEVNPPIPPNT